MGFLKIFFLGDSSEKNGVFYKIKMQKDFSIKRLIFILKSKKIYSSIIHSIPSIKY